MQHWSTLKENKNQNPILNLDNKAKRQRHSKICHNIVQLIPLAMKLVNVVCRILYWWKYFSKFQMIQSRFQSFERFAWLFEWFQSTHALDTEIDRRASMYKRVVDNTDPVCEKLITGPWLDSFWAIPNLSVILHNVFYILFGMHAQ